MLKLLRLYTSSSSARSLAKNSGIVFAGTMVGNVIAYLYHLFIGRILGPTAYGELAALLSFLYILNAPTSVLQTILTKFFSILKARRSLGQAKYLWVTVTKKVLLYEAIGMVLVLPTLPFLASFLHLNSWYYLLFLYFIFATTLIVFVNISTLQGLQNFVATGIVPTVGGFLRLLFGVLAAPFGVGSVLLSNIASNILGYGAYGPSLMTLLKTKSEKISLKELRVGEFSVPALVAVLSITALFSQDVLLVKHFFSAYEAGIYSSLSILGKIIFFASYSIGTVMYPVVSERTEQGVKSGRVVALGLGTVALISFGIAVVFFVFPSFVVRALYGTSYIDAALHLGQFGIFMSFFSLSYLLTNMCLGQNKMRVWVFPFIAAVLQASFITISHRSLGQIVSINTVVTTLLFFSLLLYYRHAK